MNPVSRHIEDLMKRDESASVLSLAPLLSMGAGSHQDCRVSERRFLDAPTPLQGRLHWEYNRGGNREDADEHLCGVHDSTDGTPGGGTQQGVSGSCRTFRGDCQ